MIIDSSFHDYYDAIAKSGVNREVRYLREKVEVEISGRVWRSTFHRIHLRFCGNNYRIAGFRGNNFLHDTNCFNVEEVDKHIKNRVKLKEFEYYLGKRKRHPDKIFFRYFVPKIPVRRDVERHFDLSLSLEGDKVVQKLAEEHASPIVTYNYDTGKAVVNDQLSRFNLARLIDPYTAFQEIMMYLGNIAKPEKIIPTISDKDMIEAKGFDLQTSFRKDPQPK